MSNRVHLSDRDRALLRLLSWTPATATLLLRASPSFAGEPFVDERRLRERLQVMEAAGFVRRWSSAQAGGGLKNYYKVTPAAFAVLYGSAAPLPARSFFAEVSPTFFDHTFRLAELVVEIVRACHAKRVVVERCIRENELAFRVGESEVRPDCFFRLRASGKAFNVAFEIDRGTEPLDSFAANGLRRKLTTYQEYQDDVLTAWRKGGKQWERPRFRCVFTMGSAERLRHLLALAAETSRHTSRRVVAAVPHDTLITAENPLFEPLLLDHSGRWQALIDLHPTAAFAKAPVRLTAPMASPLGL